MNDLITSYIRTTVPAVVGILVTWLASKGISIGDQASAGLIAFLTGSVSAVYYILVRMLEKYASPKFGWLLGYAKAPVYTVKPVLPTDL